MSARIELDGLTVTAERSGEGVQPWCELACFTYEVAVQNGSAVPYLTTGYGSRHDYSRGIDDSHGIAVMVLGELLGAAMDPDEFIEIALMGGGDKAERVRSVMRAVDAAEKMGDTLERNADRIQALEDGDE